MGLVTPRGVFAAIAFGGAATVGLLLRMSGFTGDEPAFSAVLAGVVMPLPLLAGLAAEWTADRPQLADRVRLPPGAPASIAGTCLAFSALIATCYLVLLWGAEAVGLPGAGRLARTTADVVAAFPSASAEEVAALPALGWIGLVAVVTAALAGCTLNALLAFGEEYGWRGFLLEDLGESYSGDLAMGAIWAVWHVPWLTFGLNYEEHGIWGLPSMIAFCTACATVFRRLAPREGRVLWTSALHGTVNGLGGFLMLISVDADPRVAGPAGVLGALAVWAAGEVLIAARRR